MQVVMFRLLHHLLVAIYLIATRCILSPLYGWTSNNN